MPAIMAYTRDKAKDDVGRVFIELMQLGMQDPIAMHYALYQQFPQYRYSFEGYIESMGDVFTLTRPMHLLHADRVTKALAKAGYRDVRTHEYRASHVGPMKQSHLPFQVPGMPPPNRVFSQYNFTGGQVNPAYRHVPRGQVQQDTVVQVISATR